jgi:ADP-ribose pyrophosphatase YjhB (NUDIX family)
MSNHPPRWLDWAREIFSISKSGLAYSNSDYDLERYKHLLEIAAEMLESQGELSKESILQSFSMQAGYATPKIDVRGAVLREGKILLVQERADGRWAMPGGWADLGDLPSAMVEREVREESGLNVKAAKVVAVYDANRAEPMEFYHAYKIIFLCDSIDGEIRSSYETLAVDFFDPTALPPLSLARTSERMIEEVLAHARDPRRPAAFD